MMDRAFLEGLKCPRCTGPLRLETDETGPKIETGILYCDTDHCPGVYPLDGPMTWAFPVKKAAVAKKKAAPRRSVSQARSKSGKFASGKE